MKNQMWAFIFALLSFFPSAQAGLADFTSRSVVYLVSLEEIGWKKENIVQERILPLIKELRRESFPGAQAHFMVKDMSFCLRLLALFAKREVAPYDLLIRIDLSTDLNSEQREALRRTKDDLAPYAKEVLLFKSENFPFHKVTGTESTDVAMAFINRWPNHMNREEAQEYWLEHHGPLVLKVGLPPVVKSYTQVHFRREPDEVFDADFQGLSFETITGQSEFVKFFIKNPSVRKLNEILLEDEQNFTPPPLFFAFRHLAVE